MLVKYSIYPYYVNRTFQNKLMAPTRLKDYKVYWRSIAVVNTLRAYSRCNLSMASNLFKPYKGNAVDKKLCGNLCHVLFLYCPQKTKRKGNKQGRKRGGS